MKYAIVAPLDFINKESRFYNFQNRIILRHIKLYCEKHGDVTLIDYRKPSLSLLSTYDLVIGFGINYRLIRAKKKILICFEQYPKILSDNENKAIEYYKNLNYSLSSERSGTYYKESDFDKSYKVLMLGNHKDTLRNNSLFSVLNKMHELPPAVQDNTSNSINYNPSSKNIVSILSRGDALKGIPMLIEIAKKLQNYQFHILGRDDFNKYDVFNVKNLFFHGFVDHHSNEYKSVIKDAVINLNLSTSEACSTVVLDSAALGIPFHTFGNLGVEKFFHGSFIQSQFDLSDVVINLKRFLNSPDNYKLKMSTNVLNCYNKLLNIDYDCVISEVIDNV